MRLTWLNNKFICKDLYAPFKIDKDSDYKEDLKNKYDIVQNQARASGADDESMGIIIGFSDRILKSLELYYKADIAESNNIILELVKDIGNNPLVPRHTALAQFRYTPAPQHPVPPHEYGGRRNRFFHSDDTHGTHIPHGSCRSSSES